MKKVFIVAALVATIVSCGSKGNETHTYEGILPGADVAGIHYLLSLQETGEDSTATYSLTTTYLGADNGQDQVFTDSGSVVTIVGTPDDNTAIVYQLISTAPGHEKTNFVAEGDSALTMVDQFFKKAESKLNYTLKKRL